MWMMRSFITCVMLLSDKSSGSTALQNELAKQPDVNLVERTIHNENETLYWNKAAAVLGLPQVTIMDSDDLPITQNKARREIVEFLKANLGTFNPPSDDEQLVFEGWHRLCRRYGPVFLEKSPHHLHYWSALKLMAECERRCSDIKFRYIGLVRNPMATLYSMWIRWRTVPEKRQYQWLRAYRNLLQFRLLISNRLRVFKYEELVNGQTTIKCLCAFAGIQWMPGMGSGLRTSSVQKWRCDKMFGFTPSGDVISFAQELGYSDAELSSHKRIGWPIYREVTKVAYRGAGLLRPVKQTIKTSLHYPSKYRSK
jgi:hypothetical protein